MRILPPDDEIPEAAQEAMRAVQQLQREWEEEHARVRRAEKNPNRSMRVKGAEEMYYGGLRVLARVLASYGFSVRAGDSISNDLAAAFMNEWLHRNAAAEQVTAGPA